MIRPRRPRTSPAAPNGVWPAAMPALFVLLWSTGFIGAKLGISAGMLYQKRFC